MIGTTDLIVWSHEQALEILKDISIDKKYTEMAKVEKSALVHYFQCEYCNQSHPSLADIIELKMSHEEALLTWANNLGALHLELDKSIREICAVDHVIGRTNIRQPNGNTVPACEHGACSRLRTFWNIVPLSSHYDGWDDVPKEFPLLLEIFTNQRWSIKKLLEIQKLRIDALLKDIESKKITISPGHYHKKSHLIAELKAHFDALQNQILITY